MTTTYRLRQQTSRWCRFAVVTVDVAPAAHHWVEVAQGAHATIEALLVLRANGRL